MSPWLLKVLGVNAQACTRHLRCSPPQLREETYPTLGSQVKYKQADRGTLCSGCDTASALMHSQLLWIPAQHQLCQQLVMGWEGPVGPCHSLLSLGPPKDSEPQSHCLQVNSTGEPRSKE